MQQPTSLRNIWSIAFPIILMGLTQNVISATDRYFLGKLSVVALASQGISYIYFLIFVVVGMGLGGGIQIMVARRHGENDLRGLGRTADQGLLVSLALGLILTLVYFGITDWVVGMSYHSTDIQKASLEYLYPRGFELIPVMAFYALRGFYSGVGETIILLAAVGVQAIANYFLNDALVFGKYGMPAMGVAGSAWGSCIAEYIALLVLVLDLYIRNYVHRFRLFRQLQDFDWGLMLGLLKLSWPMMIQFGLSLGSFYFFLDIVEAFGEAPLAITTLTYGTYVFFMVPTWGFGAAANTILSNLMGRQQPNRVWMAIWKIVGQCALLTVPLASIFYMFDLPIYNFFTEDPAVAAAATSTTIVLVAALIIQSMSTVMLNSMLGLGATRMGFVVELIALFFFLGYIYGISDVTDDLTIIWIGEVLYAATMLVAPFLYLRTNRWRSIKL